MGGNRVLELQFFFYMCYVLILYTCTRSMNYVFYRISINYELSVVFRPKTMHS